METAEVRCIQVSDGDSRSTLYTGFWWDSRSTLYTGFWWGPPKYAVYRVLVGTAEIRCIQGSGGDTWRAKTAGRPSHEWDVEVKMYLRSRMSSWTGGIWL